MVENKIIMTHIYKVTEMSLLTLPNVTEIELSKRKVNNQYPHGHIDKLLTFQNVLDKSKVSRLKSIRNGRAGKNWLATYKHIQLIFVLKSTSCRLLVE